MRLREVGAAVTTALYETLTDGLGFVGWLGRDCGEHRTVGDYRAWCHGCTEWCYSSDIDAGCAGCRMPGLELARARYWALTKRLDSLVYDAEEAGKRKVAVKDIYTILDGLPEAKPVEGRGSLYGITVNKIPNPDEVAKVLARKTEVDPGDQEVLITVSEADVLRRFRSIGWITLP
jgi:hypothetical protein